MKQQHGPRRQPVAAGGKPEPEIKEFEALPGNKYVLFQSVMFDLSDLQSFRVFFQHKEFKDAQNRPIRWKKAKVTGEYGMVNLRNQMTIPDDATAYAVTELESPAERAVEFVAGSDDTMTVWLNGQKIFEDLNNHGWKWDAYHFRGTLKAGRNLVLVKCANAGGGWEFSLAYPAPRQGRLFEAKPQKLDPKAYAEFARKTGGDAARGRALFSDPKGGLTMTADKANITATVGSFDGPYSIAGSATLITSNPATGELLAELPCATPDDVRTAVLAAGLRPTC